MADYSKDLYDYKYECRRNCSSYDDGYNQALEDLKFNLEEEKKAYAYNGHSLDTDKWLDDYLKSKLGK